MGTSKYIKKTKGCLNKRNPFLNVYVVILNIIYLNIYIYIRHISIIYNYTRIEGEKPALILKLPFLS